MAGTLAPPPREEGQDRPKVTSNQTATSTKISPTSNTQADSQHAQESKAVSSFKSTGSQDSENKQQHILPTIVITNVDGRDEAPTGISPPTEKTPEGPANLDPQWFPAYFRRSAGMVSTQAPVAQPYLKKETIGYCYSDGGRCGCHSCLS
jgi:hypothetical protein